MLAPRWKKVLTDLWANKSRTALVVLSIFIGVFATGVISGTRTIVVNELQRSYSKTLPAHSKFFLSDEDSFDEELLQSIRKIDGVKTAEGRRSTTVSLEVAPETWEDLQLTSLADFGDMNVSLFSLVEGVFEPKDKEVVIERSSMKKLNASVGDTIVVERSDGKQKAMHIVGVVHDLSVQPTSMTGRYYGYITTETMKWLGSSNDYNQLFLRVSNNVPLMKSTTSAVRTTRMGGGGGMGMGMPSNASTNKKKSNEPTTMQINQVINEVQAKVEKSDREARVPRGPPGSGGTDHWATSLINNLSMMMNVLGIMSIFLSGFLVTNTISALLAQHIKQIGIMKAIGARFHQIVVMYMALVFAFGVIAMLVALPITMFVTNIFVSTIAGYFNFDLSGATFPTNVLLLQAGASLLIPVVASIIPVLMGTRITVLEALNSTGIQSNTKKQKTKAEKRFSLNTLLTSLLNRPLILAVRNTFRRKARVTMTLMTLTVGGLIFIGIFTIRTSLIRTLEEFIARDFHYDVSIRLDSSYRDYRVVDMVKAIPGVAIAEAWSEGSANRIYDNGWESENISLTAVPATTELVNPVIIAGRWLLPEDENGVVITTGVLENDADIAVGSEIVLSINERETTWVVVGIATGMSAAREGFVNFSYLTRMMGNYGKTSNVVVQFAQSSPQEQAAMTEEIQTSLERQGVGVGRLFSKNFMRDRVMERFNLIIIGLMIMALLMAVVGGLGLAGTMSLNVIERTREIGIMRSIGASDGMILQIFLGEGLVIGMISWFLGSVIAFPVSILFCNAMGRMFFRTPLSFTFSVQGVFAWLALSIGLAVVSSFVPSWNATRLSVRNALAFE